MNRRRYSVANREICHWVRETVLARLPQGEADLAKLSWHDSLLDEKTYHWEQFLWRRVLCLAHRKAPGRDLDDATLEAVIDRAAGAGKDDKIAGVLLPTLFYWAQHALKSRKFRPGPAGIEALDALMVRLVRADPDFAGDAEYAIPKKKLTELAFRTPLPQLLDVMVRELGMVSVLEHAPARLRDPACAAARAEIAMAISIGRGQERERPAMGL